MRATSAPSSKTNRWCPLLNRAWERRGSTPGSTPHKSSPTIRSRLRSDLMKLSLDPTVTVPRHVTAQAEALAEWYDAHPTVRRLWAIKDPQSLCVILTLEPTMDGDDTYPAWFACSRAWMREIQSISGSAVR